MGRDGFNKTASEDLMHVSLIFKLGSLTNVIENSLEYGLFCVGKGSAVKTHG